MRFTTLFFALFCCSFFCGYKAQEPRKDYAFINHDANRISYSADSSAFVRLYKKLERIAGGASEQVRVVHIGGSHVQAGLWSSAFINEFHKKFITAGGGYFVFPFRVGKTNGQPYATSFSDGNWELCRSIGKYYCEPLGLNALNIHTTDSLNHFGVELTPRAACKFVNVVRVYHNFSPAYTFKLCDPDTEKVQRTDLPLEGYTTFSFDMPIDSVCFQLQKTDTIPGEFVLFGFSLENDLAPGFYLAGLGANGASTASFLKAKNLAQQLGTLNADLFILSLGVNDTQSRGFTKENFIAYYDTLITTIRSKNPKAAILLTTTTDNYIRYRTPNRRSIAAREATFQLMLTHDIGVWDMFMLMGGYRSMYSWYRAGLASKDKVHFNGRGYSIVGSLMFDAFMKAYQYSSENQ